MSKDDKASEASEQEKVGGWAGLGAGILTGAKIGSAVLPLAGLDTFAGAVVGCKKADTAP
jgi:hypothetical protein